jgi:hypothetical protein
MRLQHSLEKHLTNKIRYDEKRSKEPWQSLEGIYTFKPVVILSKAKNLGQGKLYFATLNMTA